MTAHSKGEGYIIEMIPVGNVVKVSAIDPATLREVSIVGPKSASKMDLQQTAVRKLQYVLNKEKSSNKSARPTGSTGKGGIIV